MTQRTARLFAAATLALGLHAAHAADTAPTPTPTPAPARTVAAPADKLAEARTLFADKRWSAALDALRKVNDSGNADWNNLMGYALRKGNAPDLAASEKHYDAALRIDPRHRNTLEYSGELYLMKGELDKAQARLATLATECASTCEQYTELKAAIERYRAAGNKYVASSTW